MGPKILKSGLVVLMAGAMILVGLFYWHRFEVRRSAKAHAIGHARQDLRSVGLGILVMCEMDGRPLVEFRDGKTNLSGKEVFSRLSQSSAAMRIARPNERSAAEQRLCDPWGNEIHVRVLATAGKMHITLWSNGPNQQDDNGINDDIVDELDVTSN